MIEDNSVQLRKKTRLKSKFHRYSLNLFSSKGSAEKSRILKMSSSRDQLNKGTTQFQTYTHVSGGACACVCINRNHMWLYNLLVSGGAS